MTHHRLLFTTWILLHVTFHPRKHYEPDDLTPHTLCWYFHQFSRVPHTADRTRPTAKDRPSSILRREREVNEFLAVGIGAILVLIALVVPSWMATLVEYDSRAESWVFLAFTSLLRRLSSDHLRYDCPISHEHVEQYSVVHSSGRLSRLIPTASCPWGFVRTRTTSVWSCMQLLWRLPSLRDSRWVLTWRGEQH
jgi:hypothetical protein